MVTIYDIAKKLGVSPPTVSKALHDQPDISKETKDRVHKLAHELGYTPNSSARHLITNKSWLIGIIYEEDDLGIGIEHPLFSGIMNAFKNIIEKEGYELLFISHNLGTEQLSYLEHCRYRRVDGVIILNCKSENAEVRRVIHSSLPVVSSNIVFPSIPSITTDNVTASINVIHYLYNLGHRRIAHITGPLDRYASAGVERLQGYEKGLQSVGLPYDSRMVVHSKKWTIQAGYDAMKALLSTNLPFTAVYCGGDILAFGVLQACKKCGIAVPDDISIVGFDDNEGAAYFQPALTTVRQDRQKIGEVTAELLLKKIRGEEIPFRYLIPATLVERNSCHSI